MFNKKNILCIMLYIIISSFTSLQAKSKINVHSQGETIGIFFDLNSSQINFAAKDIEKALIKHKFNVQLFPLDALSSDYPNRKVVIMNTDNPHALRQCLQETAENFKDIPPQGYVLRTTLEPGPQLASNSALWYEAIDMEINPNTYWVIGGDINGAMYGGLEIAENIHYHGFTSNINLEETPAILKRGIKLNLPWDKRSGTYSGFSGTSAQLAIKDVWDMTFWTTWFDEMARNRYNVISLWSNNPFSSLVSVPGYEDMSLDGVQYNDGTVIPMTIAQKITFWQQVMAYAHSMGFEFFIFNWNVFVNGGNPGKYGISEDPNDAQTRDYMYKAMTKLLETYPDFDGFGMSIGENGGTEDYVWNTYGKAMYDYAKVHTTRNLRFIHRFHVAGFSEMLSKFAPLRTLSNFKFEASVKFSQAHMYSTATPNWWPDEFDDIKNNNLKTWLTVRNDDVYYLTWGDPDFARTYVNSMIGLGSIFTGFYMGSDGYNPTRTFFCKDNTMNGQLDVQRQQYMMMLWGRLSYDPNTPDSVFINYMADKYPTVSSDTLFNAWRKSSRGIQLTNELVQGTLSMDFMWYPEFCSSNAGFKTIGDFGGCSVAKGSNLCTIGNSASNSCGSKKTSYQIADSIESNALSAISLISGMSAGTDKVLAAALNNIKGLSYIGLYYAEKIRGATYKKANNTSAARDAMGRAYCNWMSYVNLMDANFTMMKMQRVDDITSWHMFDNSVLNEYTSLGGSGTPNCAPSGSLTLFTNMNPIGGGLITLNPSGGYYDSSTVVTVTATSKSGYTFSSWSGDLSGSTNPTTITMNSNKNVTANFVVGTDVTALTGWVSGATHAKVSGSNRLMTVMVMGENNGSNFSATGVTYGGQAMTKQIEKLLGTTYRTYASIFTLNEAGVAAASTDSIKVTWSLTPSVGFDIVSVLLCNVDQTIPVSAIADSALTGTNVVTKPLAAGNGDMVIMCGSTADNRIITFDNGFTLMFEANKSWGDGVCGYKIGSGANETPSFTQSSSGRMVLCAIVAKKSVSSSVEFSTPEMPLPSETQLNQNYPNPFNPETTISYQLSEGSHARLTIRNILGEEVNRLVDRDQAAGHYSVIWNGKDFSGNKVSSGIYFYVLETNNALFTKSLILLQ